MTDTLKQEQTTLSDALRKEFHPQHLQARLLRKSADEKSAKFNLYIDVRQAFNRLDSVVGPTNWQLQYEWDWVNKVVCCTLYVFDSEKEEWIFRIAHAALESEGPMSSSDKIKTAETYAARRVAMEWGIGRYLWYAVRITTENHFEYIPITTNTKTPQIVKGTVTVVRTADWTETRTYDGWGNVTQRNAVKNKKEA